jgi:hypothetical protein
MYSKLFTLCWMMPSRSIETSCKLLIKTVDFFLNGTYDNGRLQ